MCSRTRAPVRRLYDTGVVMADGAKWFVFLVLFIATAFSLASLIGSKDRQAVASNAVFFMLFAIPLLLVWRFWRNC